MAIKNVLLIDDSATIRRLVDNELSAAGFHVVLAPTAEEGLAKAESEKPDLIILDHQLPGTTGYEVCCQLLANPSTATIPVVASSTLRKKAYSEYIDCDNVVDMLPKPYTAEVLVATVNSAIDTAAMVVQSQSDGSSVPEVINELGESDLAGTFDCFGLREVIDLVNNGSKRGVLEILSHDSRVYVFIDAGRIQAVTASGVDLESVTSQLPENLSELAPVVKFTVTGKKGSEIDGLVGLLDNKVLDPRLLKKLLRLQAAILLRMCFNSDVKSFRFDKNQSPPQLFSKLSLDSSLVALLVEGAMQADDSNIPTRDLNKGFVRKSIRGQSVDRAGLSSKHVQLMKVVSEPTTLGNIANSLGWSEDEANRVVSGFEMADLVETVEIEEQTIVYVVSGDKEFKQESQQSSNKCASKIVMKSVSDALALGLLLRRQRPDAIVIDVSDEDVMAKFMKLKEQDERKFSDCRLIAVKNESDSTEDSQLARLGFDFAVTKTASRDALMNMVCDVKDQSTNSSGVVESMPGGDSMQAAVSELPIC